MAVPLTRGLKRAPKWAWATAAGVSLGAIAIKLHKGRATDTPAATATDPTQIGSPTPGLPGSGNAATTIMPPVIVTPPSTDPNEGVPVLQGLYIGGMQDLLHGWESLVGPLSTTVNTLALDASPSALAALALAGSAPSSPPVTTPTAAAPIAVAAAPAPAPAAPTPPPAPAPAKCPGGFPLGTPPDCYQFAWNYETRQSGKNKWCVKMERHIHQDGRDVTVSATAQKVHDGPC